MKTSSLEGAATTVYANGGRGNARLMAWEGERTVTFTMEDALISPEGFMILSGAGLIEASVEKPVYQHMTETVAANGDGVKMLEDEGSGDDTTLHFTVNVSNKPHLPAGNENFAYVMFVKNGEIVSEPFIPLHGEDAVTEIDGGYQITVKADATEGRGYSPITKPDAYDSVLVDYYVEKTSSVKEIKITADKFGGNYYLEASTLFRDTNGVDMPAEFVIPNCKIQSNFTFTMASTGDPSSFTFTMDAFPDYTRFDPTEKVFARIQIVEESVSADLARRTQTMHDKAHEAPFI